MLNVPEIKKVLQSTPLCADSLIKSVGMATEYCAVGALARGAGITDKQLRSVSGGDTNAIFMMNPNGFKTRYGITSPDILSQFMGINDKSPSVLDRTKEVISKVEDEQISEINAVVNELIEVGA